MTDKTTIIVHSGDMDKLYSALIIANGALSMGLEASVYFTFWGLQRLRKGKLEKGPLSKMNLLGIGKRMVKQRMKKTNVASLEKLIQDFKELGGKIIACDMTMEIMGIKEKDLRQDLITDETILVSIQHANQEIGTIQDIQSIGQICKEQGILFHTDATHTFTRVPINVQEIPVDLMTISAHTIHGPKGVGGLYIRKNTPITKLMDGGFQEYNLRAGIENIPGAVGFAKAVELVSGEENAHLKEMRDHLIDRILSEVPDSTLNGDRWQRTPQNANITFNFVEGESITLHLDMRGIAVSTGSACFSRSLEASHVILGIGGDHERAHGSVRFSLGRYNTMNEMDHVVESIAEVVDRLRAISPLKETIT